MGFRICRALYHVTELAAKTISYRTRKQKVQVTIKRNFLKNFELGITSIVIDERLKKWKFMVKIFLCSVQIDFDGIFHIIFQLCYNCELVGLSCFGVYFCFVWNIADTRMIHLVFFILSLSILTTISVACLGQLKIGHLLDLNLPSDLRSRLRFRAAGAWKFICEWSMLVTEAIVLWLFSRNSPVSAHTVRKEVGKIRNCSRTRTQT